jgi:hypothetical protein
LQKFLKEMNSMIQAINVAPDLINKKSTKKEKKEKK